MVKFRSLSELLGGAALVFGLIASLPIVARAQDAGSSQDLTSDSPGNEARSAPVSTESQPQRIGSFLVNPSAAVSEGYTDNLFATRNNKVGDAFTSIRPSLTINSDWAKHAISFEANAEIVRYSSHPSEDYNNYGVGAEGRFDFSKSTYMFGGLRYEYNHEARDSPDAVAGTEPTAYENPQGFLGLYDREGNFKIRIGGTLEALNFHNVSSSQGTINNNDRDRTMSTFGTRVGYMVDPSYEVFVEGSLDRRNYWTSTDDYGYQRSSSGVRVGTGVTAKLGDVLKAEGMVGYLGQRYKDPSFANVNVPDFAANLQWNATPDTTVTGWLDRTLGETTLAGSSGYISTYGGLRVDQTLLTDLVADARFGYSDDRYQGINRNDVYLVGGGGLRYFLMPQIYLGGDYTFIQRNSNVAGDDFTENQVMVSLGYQLAPAYNKKEWDQNGGLARLFAGNSALAGFYIGTQGEYGDLNTELLGSRGGSGGTLQGDFGNTGFGYGLFGGYGVVRNQWYGGLELDGSRSDTYWTHAHTDESRYFEVHKKDSFGVSARLGFLPNALSMVYGRVGVVATTFNTQYTHQGFTVDQNNTEMGLRIGAGIEAPLSPALFTRLDYTYTTYPDYNVFTNRQNDYDNFANSEGMLRLGVGYRFGASNKHPKIKPVDFSGFYAGVQAGYGGLNTQDRGPRSPGALSAEFGDTGGTGGVFAGYGKEFSSLHNLYAGVELNADHSDTSWDHQRVPNGRNYSVQKGSSFGGGLRLGYVVDGLALFYGRAGSVWTDFNTDYTTNGANISQRGLVQGLRAGGGIEIAASHNIFIRADYTHTSYQDYNIYYGHNVDNFKNSENLFRLGVGYRF